MFELGTRGKAMLLLLRDEDLHMHQIYGFEKTQI